MGALSIYIPSQSLTFTPTPIAYPPSRSSRFSAFEFLVAAMPLGGNKVADVSSSSSSSRKSRRRQKVSTSSASVPAMAASSVSTMQALYDVSRDVFTTATPGFVPPPGAVARLSEFLNGLTLQDVGLDASMACFRADPEGPPKVTYMHFFDCPQFSVGVFCLPESAVIPLHNHPGMTVFSKLLLGTMHIKSYDWAKSSRGGSYAVRASDGARLAKLNTNTVFDASSETVVLYPEDGGNLHCFTAVTPCAVLDVMGPPYCRAQGRDCSYYAVSPRSSHSGDGVIPGAHEQYAWLKKVPCTFNMTVEYMRASVVRK